jgi:hypothetical protein
MLTRRAGIKKRNHKMLDYDSMRSKVKRLTEKPDKDPAKLPRTEKEQDMVSLSDFLRDGSPSGSSVNLRESSASLVSRDTNFDLAIPSPPKALNGIRQRLGLGVEEDEPNSGARIQDDLISSPNRDRRSGRTLIARTSSIISNYASTPTKKQGSGDREGIVQQDENQGVSAVHSGTERLSLENPSPRSSIFTVYDSQAHHSPSLRSTRSSSTLVPTSSVCNSASTSGVTRSRQSHVSSTIRTPFFEPSELEDIMAPLKADFVRRQADKLEQAKAAYEQLNEQLMSELPQLIDLRYVIRT